MLMNTLRRVWALSRDRARMADAQAGSGPAEPASAPATPAWRLLAPEVGVQDLQYGDIARPGVQRLFRHPPRRLLDIGCGSGAVGEGLKQSIPGLWVWGCELNPQAAQAAAAKLDRVTSVPRAQWSAEDVALVNSVDTVLLLDVLEHMYNPWAELEFLADRLPPGAQVIVSLPNVGHLGVIGGLSQGAFDYRPLGILDITHVRFFTFAGMREMFDQTGFEVDETWILSGSPDVDIERFPAQVATGKAILQVDSAEDWARLNAIQFGFRLSRKPGSGIIASSPSKRFPP